MSRIEANILILATDGFEQSELLIPQKKLTQAGASVTVVSPDGSAIRGWDGDDWGTTVRAQASLDDVAPEDYDALVLPGGQINPDTLRVNGAAIALIQSFAAAGKPIAAVCHAPWLLIEAGLADGRRMTSYKSIRRDVENAGATWLDESVVQDGGIITSRNPDDLQDFCDEIVRTLVARAR